MNRRGGFYRLVVLFCLFLLVGSAFQDAAAQDKAKPRLRYGWKPNQEYQYEVEIEVDLPDSTLKLNGHSVYRVRSADGGRFVLVHTGMLAQHERPKPGKNAFGPRHSAWPMMGPMFSMPDFSEHELTVDSRGEVTKLSGETQLPHMLGDLALLTIEPFPVKAQSSWDEKQAVTVTTREATGEATRGPGRFRRFGPRFGDEPESTIRGGEKRTTYRILSTTDKEIKIRKKSQFETGDKEESGAAREQESQGDLTFDRKRGVLSKAEIKLTNTFNEGAVSVRVPINIRYRLLDKEELARLAVEHKERAEKRAAEQAQAKKDATSPLSDDEADELIAALGNEKTRKDALKKLAKKQADAHQDEIANALEPLLDDSNTFVQMDTLEALKSWATTDNVPKLIALVDQEDGFVRSRAIEVLGELKDERGAEAVAAVFYKARGEARKALEQMGPMAEPYVLPLLDDRDEGVRSDACRVLAVIGTDKSRDKLEKLAVKKRGFDAGAARDALEKIAKRE